MRPSFSPRRVKIDDATGRVRVDEGVLLRSSSTLTMVPPAKLRPSRRLLIEGALQAVLTGVIIAVVLTPVMIGFATMIYGHPEFESVMPMLTKLVFVSSVAHQLAISVLSPMPYAIAQTQDAGLIFLSSMAVSIMSELSAAGVPMGERIATVVVHLSISATLVGLGLIVLGKLKLASFVQYLPTPVIGGYLAYIGFFMIKGGLTLMTGAPLTGFSSWVQLLSNTHYLALLAPGAVCGVLLSLISARYQHFAVFPCCLVAMPVLFFLVLFLTGTSMADARAYGYFSQETPAFSLIEVYGLFDFSNIHWEVMFPQQLPTMLSMFLVIAFASSLDIASICMGTGAAMDYNEQLQTVGTSNLISGVIGGYTGSYIFSQTVFAFRFHPAKAEEQYPGFSRLVGFTLAACELGIALAPFSLTTVVPKFLFGSVMIFIGVELLKTWLIGVHSKLLMPEYATVIGTFLFLNALGVQVGLAAGIGLAALCFLIEYSRAQSIRIVHKTSNVIRNAEQHQLLYAQEKGLMKGQPIVTVELQGHIFFGSATRIQKRVRKAVYVRQTEQTPAPASGTRPVQKDSETLPLLLNITNSVDGTFLFEKDKTLVNLKGVASTDHQRGRTRFVIFDFSQVTGMDATAARSCFLALKMLFRQHKIRVVYCGMQRNVEFLLRANDVLDDNSPESSRCHVTDDLDLALDWCEQQLILTAARKKSYESGRAIQAFMPSHGAQAPELSLVQVLSAYVAQEKRRQTPDLDRILEKDVASRFTIQHWEPQERLFASLDVADVWYVLLRGQVTLFTVINKSADGSKIAKSSISDSLTPRHFRRPASRERDRLLISSSTSAMEKSRANEPFAEDEDRELVGRVRAGCIFGDMDFMLCQPRSFDAVCSEEGTVTAKITRQDMESLVAQHPTGAYLLQEIVLRASYMTLAEKLHHIVV